MLSGPRDQTPTHLHGTQDLAEVSSQEREAENVKRLSEREEKTKLSRNLSPLARMLDAEISASITETNYLKADSTVDVDCGMWSYMFLNKNKIQ